MRGVSPLPRGRAGGCRAHCTRTWPSMPSNKPFMSAVRPVKSLPPWKRGLIHHSDRGVQYLSLHYTERLAQAGIAPSVGSVGDSSDKGTRSLPRQAVSRGAGSTTTPPGQAGGKLWPSPSSGCTRPNSSVIPAKAGTGAARGVTARQSSPPPSNGCIGIITGACSDPSAMCLRLHSRHTTPINCMSRRWPPDSSKSPSGKPGAVQIAFSFILVLRSFRRLLGGCAWAFSS